MGTSAPPALGGVDGAGPGLYAALEPQPGLEDPLALAQADDPCAPREAAPAVLAEAGGPAVEQADAVQLSLEVVDVVVAAEGAEHVAGLHEGREEAGVERGAAHGLVAVAAAGHRAPHLVPLRQRNVEEGEGGQAHAGRGAREPADLVAG